MGVNSLIAEQGDTVGKTVPVDLTTVKLDRERTITPNDILVVGQDDKDVKHSARRGGWIAYQELAKRGAVSPDSVIARSGVAFDFASPTFIQVTGASAGLCFLVRMAQGLIEEYLRFKGKPIPHFDFAATGVFSNFTGDSRVHAVKAIKAKINAALGILETGGIVFYPAANNPLDPALQQEAKRRDITFVAVETPKQVVSFLLEKYGFSEEPTSKRWLKWVLAASFIVFMGCMGWLIKHLLSPPSGPDIVETSGPSATAPAGAPATPPLLTPISVEPALFYEGDQGLAVPLSEGKALTQGDGFRIRLEVDRECFLYVFEVGSGNHITWLFPPTSYSSPPPEVRQLWIPQDDQWLELDEVKGKEQILVLATTRPSAFLEEMRSSISTSKSLPESERRELKTRLVEYLERQQKEYKDTLVRLAFRHE